MARVGPVPIGGNLPSAIRRQRCSVECALDVGRGRAPREFPLLEWLISMTSGVEEPIHFIGGNLTASAAVRAGWTTLRQAMRSWGVESELELSEWLGNQGFPAARPGSHISARGQEHILTEGCREDARVALLEYVFVAITLETGRQRPREFLPSTRAQSCPTVRNRRVGVLTDVPQDSWAQLDDVDLEVEFLRRVPMLKSCPHFLRGRFRHALHITLQERCRAKLVGDTVGEERAWKAFGLVPAMMLHRPRGVGSIGRDELVEKADKFFQRAVARTFGRVPQLHCLPWSRSDTG